MSKEMREEKIIENEYFNDLKKIKETIKSNQNKAMIVVNTSMIMNYYEIGMIITKENHGEINI